MVINLLPPRVKASFKKLELRRIQSLWTKPHQCSKRHINILWDSIHFNGEMFQGPQVLCGLVCNFFFLSWRTNANLNTATWNKEIIFLQSLTSDTQGWDVNKLLCLFFFSKCFKNYNWLKLSSENSQIQLHERRKLDCATFSQITTISYSSNWGGEKEKGEIIYSNKASQRRWCLKSTRLYRAARRVLSSTTLEQTSADVSDVIWVLKGQHLTSHYVR